MYLKRLLLNKLLTKEYPKIDPLLASRLLDFATAKISEWTKNEESNLILNVRGFGKFYWRKRKIQRVLESRRLKTNNPELQEFVKRADTILEKYKGYEQKKEYIRRLNYGDDYKTSEELKELKLQKLNR